MIFESCDKNVLYYEDKDIIIWSIKKAQENKFLSFVVPQAGLEPARPNGHRILSPACLPIPPPRQNLIFMNFYISKSGKRGSNPRPQPWQGCALPAELFSRLECKYIKSIFNNPNEIGIIFQKYSCTSIIS